MRVGLDIGSTTIKCVVLGEHDELLYSTYERHYSHILEKAQELLRRIDAEHLHGRKALLSISGSAGMGLADSCGVPFVQEVFSTRVAVKKFVPATDCVIELGGEDAKILFLTNGTEVRMNGSCAGGTGAFIDQMATLLKMGADGIRSDALFGCAAGALHVTPYHSFPSGVTASASKRHEYAAWAEERGAYIIEDDYDSEFSAAAKQVETIFSVAPERVIYINTFSKTFAPSMRMGYMLLPARWNRSAAHAPRNQAL